MRKGPAQKATWAGPQDPERVPMDGQCLSARPAMGRRIDKTGHEVLSSQPVSEYPPWVFTVGGDLVNAAPCPRSPPPTSFQPARPKAESAQPSTSLLPSLH